MQTEALEITKNQPLTEPATKEEASERRAIDENKKADKITVQQVSMESGQKAGAGEKAKTVTAMISDSIPEISTAPIHGFVADAQIVAPVAGKMLLQVFKSEVRSLHLKIICLFRESPY
jgi:hypothetical protein